MKVLLACNADPQMPGLDHAPPLVVAAHGGHTNVVQELLKHKADVEAAATKDGAVSDAPRRAAACRALQAITSAI